MLFFQEQIQGPEKAPIARFDGLGCYQTHSEIMAVLGSAGGKKNPFAARRQTGTSAMRSGAHEKATLLGRGLWAGKNQ